MELLWGKADAPIEVTVTLVTNTFRERGPSLMLNPNSYFYYNMSKMEEASKFIVQLRPEITHVEFSVNGMNITLDRPVIEEKIKEEQEEQKETYKDSSGY